METKYKIGDTIYLITDIDQLPRMIIDIMYMFSSRKLLYRVVSGEKTTEHYEMEMSDTKLFNL